MTIDLHTLLPIEEPFDLLSETTNAASIVYEIRLHSSTARCPSCRTVSHCKHSRYVRKIKDLPLAERSVCFHVHLHKWFCRNSSCSTCIFTERLSWAAPHHQMTIRLENTLLQLALAMNSLAAERTCHALHIPVSHDTLLRMLKKVEPELSVPSPFCRD